MDACPLFELAEFSSSKITLEKMINSWKPGEKLAPERLDEGIVLSKPCSDAKDLLMADLQIHNGLEAGNPMRFNVLDSTVMCNLLECVTEKEKEFKCSTTLAYAWGDFEGIKLHILKDGRVRMRRAPGKEHALRVFAKLERFVVGAVICDCCGCDFLSILADMSPSRESKHTVLNAGSSLHVKDEKRPPETEKILESARESVMAALELMIENKEPVFNQNLLCDMLEHVSVIEGAGVGIGQLQALAAIYFAQDGFTAMQILHEMTKDHVQSRLMLEEILAHIRSRTFEASDQRLAEQESLILTGYANRIDRSLLILESLLE